MREYLNGFSPRQLQMILGGMVLLIGVALFTYVVWPQVMAYREASKIREVLERDIANGGDLASQITTKKYAVTALSKRLNSDFANLPPKQMEAYIIGRLQKISWQHKIELVGVKPATGKVIQTLQEILFDVDVSGDYFDLYAWLRGLSNELGFVVITKFEMRPMEQNKEVPLLSVKLTMASYRSTEQ